MSEQDTCYTTGYICQIADNFLMSHNQGIRVYDEILNADNSETSSYSGLALTSKYDRTFSSNDPFRMIASGRPASDAGFQQKIDGHTFRDNPCSNISSESDLNIEPINFYDYTLASTQTEYITANPGGKRLSIDEKRRLNIGEMWCRNTLSTRIDRLQDVLPSLRTQPQIYNNAVDLDIIYDTAIVYTPDTVYIERFSYDYNTGDHTPGNVTPIYMSQDDSELSKLIRTYFNEDTNTLYFGKTVQYDVKTVIPEIYKYSVSTGTYSTAYGASQASDDLSSYMLPQDLIRNFDIKSVGNPILVQNDKLKKYTVIYSAYLATTYTGQLTGEFEGDIYCIFMHNYKETSTGLGYIDSVVYHPENKREYRYDDTEVPGRIILGDDRQMNIGYVLPASLDLVIDPIDVPLRPAKLKEIQYIYNNQITTKSRLPINDMSLAKVTSVNTLVDAYTPHVSGGAIDFASPRYQPMVINVESNISDISIVRVDVLAKYYDGVVEEWEIAGEIRPRPLNYKFKDMLIVDAVSYTTKSAVNLIKLILETQEPKHIVEYIIDNSTSAAQSFVDDFNLQTPTVTAVNLSGASLSGASLSGASLSGASLSGSNLVSQPSSSTY